VAAAYEAVRARLPAREEDRVIAPEIETVRDMILRGDIVDAAEGAAGALDGIPG
jgi:histidine ammonia-lyase